MANSPDMKVVLSAEGFEELQIALDAVKDALSNIRFKTTWSKVEDD